MFFFRGENVIIVKIETRMFMHVCVWPVVSILIRIQLHTYNCVLFGICEAIFFNKFYMLLIISSGLKTIYYSTRK